MRDPSQTPQRAFAWREIPFPADGGFQMLVDTREQLPLFDERQLFVRRTTVKNGDYTLAGFEDQFYLELKRLSDFMGFIGRERNIRTAGKLERIRHFPFKALCVLESESALHSPTHLHSTMTPEHVRGFLTSLHVKYGIMSYFNPDEDAMRRWILDRAIYFYNQQRKVGAV